MFCGSLVEYFSNQIPLRRCKPADDFVLNPVMLSSAHQRRVSQPGMFLAARCACWLFLQFDNVFALGWESFSMKECVKQNPRFVFFVYSKYLSLALFPISSSISPCLWDSLKQADMLLVVWVYIFRFVLISVFFLFSIFFEPWLLAVREHCEPPLL